MASPFEIYGIKHLSPSSCNTFIASPAMFVLQKCLKMSTSVGAAAHRGTAVEHGVVHGLYNPSVDSSVCVEMAIAEFDKLAALTQDPKKERERDGIPDMVVNGLLELRPYGLPTSTQGAVYVDVEGLDVPLHGFYDVEWENHGVGVDLKTTHALPSKISIGHARQFALYQKARGWKSTRGTYITPKKVATYELENVDTHFNALVRVAKTIQRFLAISEDPMELASLVAPDVDSFYFNDPITRAAAADVWGI